LRALQRFAQTSASQQVNCAARGRNYFVTHLLEETNNSASNKTGAA